jgi:transcriptional regulator with XRE-family HTH domain
MQTPGACLRAARRRANLTQIQLADQVGVTSQYISALEKDLKRNPSREIIKRIGQVLDIPFETLLFGGDAKPGLSESDVVIARQIRDLPAKYRTEILTIIIKGMAESDTKPLQNGSSKENA